MKNAILRKRDFMSTTITIKVVQDSASTIDISNAIEDAYSEFDRIVERFTRFNENSELSNLNRNSGSWCQVSEEMVMLVSKMLEMAEASDGAFDPTVIDFLETYGYDPQYNFSKLDDPGLEDQIQKIAKERKTWKDIEVDRDNHSIKLAEGQRIDLGGIGKGYAIDCAYEKLDKFESFLIDAGGDLRVKGVNERGNKWRLGLKHLGEASKTKDKRQKIKDNVKTWDNSERELLIIGEIEAASGQALACSGSWARKVKQFHHIIDTRTGKPVEDILTVYVTGPTATLADAWATALFVGGKKLLDRLPEGVEAMMVTKDNTGVKTKGFGK